MTTLLFASAASRSHKALDGILRRASRIICSICSSDKSR
jgi:hypothetical protein